MRFAAVILALALSCSASAGVSKARFHSLRAVEAAFYGAGAPFQEDWQPNRYLAPLSNPRQALPAALRLHLIGTASRINSSTFKGGEAWVFDTQASAVGLCRLLRTELRSSPAGGQRRLHGHRLGRGVEGDGATTPLGV